MKILFYCPKGKPYLTYGQFDSDHNDMPISFEGFYTIDELWGDENILNGKIIAECDFEVEEITTRWGEFETEKYSEFALQELSGLTHQELCSYFGKLRNMDKGSKHCGYAIKIKNLHIFDEPKELFEFKTVKNYRKYQKDLKVASLIDLGIDAGKKDKTFDEDEFCDYENLSKELQHIMYGLQRAQNMMWVYDGDEKKILISIRPEWLCKILNGEKTIEVRKKVLKEML